MMADVDIARVLRLRAEDPDVSLDEAVELEQAAARHEECASDPAPALRALEGGL